MSADPRRQVPRTDTLLADPRLAEAGRRLGRGLVKAAVQAVQDRIRDGGLPPDDAVEAVLAPLPGSAASLRPVVNATGVLVHTNLGRAPLSAAAVEALEVIEAEGSRTLAEMRSLVGVLRQPGSAPLAPIGTLDDVRRLARPDGRPRVTVTVSGALDGLDPVVAAALYRVAQESVTNAARHARAATVVAVEVVTAADAVRLTVRDDGGTAPPPDGGGFGLPGMAERAALLGGSLSAGPAQHGGWLVEATLPRHRAAP
jgi:hypothetical protein